MPEAHLEDSGSGLVPASDGWFVVNVRDSRWFTSDTLGSACVFQSRDYSFPQLGIILRVLEPGQANALYHSESDQEAFLVLSGECRLLVEGEERLLRAWDFFHCPAGTEHIFVGAGDGPSVILMVRRSHGDQACPLPSLGACGESSGERGGGNLRPGAGIRGIGGTPPRASVLLGQASLGLVGDPSYPTELRIEERELDAGGLN